MLNARHRERFLDGLLFLYWQVAIGLVEKYWRYGRKVKVQGNRSGDFYDRLRDFYSHGLSRQGKGKQPAGCQYRKEACVSHGLLLNSVCFWPTRRVGAPWDSGSVSALVPGADAPHRGLAIRA